MVSVATNKKETILAKSTRRHLMDVTNGNRGMESGGKIAIRPSLFDWLTNFLPTIACLISKYKKEIPMPLCIFLFGRRKIKLTGPGAEDPTGSHPAVVDT
jgi:hypothetical protein